MCAAPCGPHSTRARMASCWRGNTSKCGSPILPRRARRCARSLRSRGDRIGLTDESVYTTSMRDGSRTFVIAVHGGHVVAHPARHHLRLGAQMQAEVMLLYFAGKIVAVPALQSLERRRRDGLL